MFLLIAIVGYIGDGPLHQPDNVWTNWIIQIGLVILGIKFTRLYPEYATTRAEAPPGTTSDRARDARQLLRPLAAYLVPVGILVMILGGDAWWVGAALLVLGILTSRALRRADERAETADSSQTSSGVTAPFETHAASVADTDND